VKILVAGAGGFVGRALCPALERAGHTVVRGVRPFFDADDVSSVARALEGVDVAYWLIHGLRRDAYGSWEKNVAAQFGHACKAAGVSRIVYLGGVQPGSGGSRHLSARAATGDALRASGVEVVELRAGMIIGAGSESWILARDACARLLLFVSPPWTKARQQPVAIDDVIFVLVQAPELPPGVHEVPGPEILTAREIVARTSALFGHRARFVPVPLFPRRIAARLAPVITRAHPRVARELFSGMGVDLVGDGDGVFRRFPEHRRLSFDEAASRALAADDVSLSAHVYEGLVHLAGKLTAGRGRS